MVLSWRGGAAVFECMCVCRGRGSAHTSACINISLELRTKKIAEQSLLFFIHCRRVVCAVFGAVGLFNKENERRQQGEKYRKLTQNSQQGNRENDNSSLFTQCLPKRSLLQLCTRFFLGTAPIALSGHALMLFSSLSDAVPSESGAIEARPGGSINGHIGKYYDSLFAVEKHRMRPEHSPKVRFLATPELLTF